MTKEIADGLKPLFEKARKEGLWFHCNYQDLWFSPDELEERQKNGYFCWGAVNWTLKKPDLHLQQLQYEVTRLITEAANVQTRINKWNVSKKQR